jgi:hypothetical protein
MIYCRIKRGDLTLKKKIAQTANSTLNLLIARPSNYLCLSFAVQAAIIIHDITLALLEVIQFRVA